MILSFIMAIWNWLIKIKKIQEIDSEGSPKIELPIDPKKEVVEPKEISFDYPEGVPLNEVVEERIKNEDELVIQVFREKQSENTTLGRIMIGLKEWFVLEDAIRLEKQKSITAIPEGRYEITLRPWGRIYENYKKFGLGWNKGTLWLRNVPNFQFILIHIGNKKEHTQGCLLVGKRFGKDSNGDYQVYDSTAAYKEIYPIVRDFLLKGKKVFIEINNPKETTYYD